MRSAVSRFPAVVVLLAAVLALAGCAPDQSQADAEEDLCQSLATFGDAVRSFRDLDPTTASLNDIEAAEMLVAGTWDQVQIDANQVEAADATALDAAWTDLSDAVNAAPSDEPIEDVLAGLQPEVEAVQTAYDEMRDGLGCE